MYRTHTVRGLITSSKTDAGLSLCLRNMEAACCARIKHNALRWQARCVLVLLAAPKVCSRSAGCLPVPGLDARRSRALAASLLGVL